MGCFSVVFFFINQQARSGIKRRENGGLLIPQMVPRSAIQQDKMQDQTRCRRISVESARDLGGMATAVEDCYKLFAKNVPRLACLTAALVAFGPISLNRARADDSKTQIVPVQASTIPANGDLNPYGVAFVPAGFPTGGATSAGDILVSNFNAKSNVQGTGTTIVSITPDGARSLFFKGTTTPLGLTTALGVLAKGFVIVGNLPTDQNGAPLQGSLIILDKNGSVVNTLTNSNQLDGPWDLTVFESGDLAQVFVSCVLNGTVTRLDLVVSKSGVTVRDMVEIASGYKFGLNSAALVVGPTGVAYDPQSDILYVASTQDNKIYGVSHAGSATSSSGTGAVVYQDNNHLHGPLGLVTAPNGHLISSQGDAINASKDPAQQSEIVEFTKTGTFVGQFSLDSATGAAFGIAIQRVDKGAVDFAAVNDATNALSIFEFTVN
jgi:hypothetical protein